MLFPQTISNLKSCQSGLDKWTESDVTRQIFGAIHGEQSQPSGQESVKRVPKEFVVNQNLSPAQVGNTLDITYPTAVSLPAILRTLNFIRKSSSRTELCNSAHTAVRSH